MGCLELFIFENGQPMMTPPPKVYFWAFRLTVKGTLLHFCEAFDCVQWALLTERLTLSAPKNISNIVSCAKKERKIFYTTSNTFAYAVMSCTSQTESPLLSALLSVSPSHTIWLVRSF